MGTSGLLEAPLTQTVCPQQPQALCIAIFHAQVCYSRDSIFCVLQSLGFSYVIDTIVGTDLALQEYVDELVARWEGEHPLAPTISSTDASTSTGTGRKGAWVAPPCSTAVSSTSIHLVDEAAPGGGGGGEGGVPAVEEPVSGLPLLVSSCPGWVCYAEKTVPESIPYICRVKSPQQITGALVKYLLPQVAVAEGGGGGGSTPLLSHEIYHVTVMPCYDKKLEASRKDFYWEHAACVEVDCVLTSGEVVDWLNSRDTNLADVVGTPRKGMYPVSLDSTPAMPTSTGVTTAPGGKVVGTGETDFESLLCGVLEDGSRFVGPCVQEGSSDGFMQVVLASAAQRLNCRRGGCEGEDVAVSCSSGKNSDSREMSVSCGSVFLRGAIAYGFRNIQGTVNKMKRGKCTADLVEVMACPSGCVNGGGQIKLDAPIVPSTATMTLPDAPMTESPGGSGVPLSDTTSSVFRAGVARGQLDAVKKRIADVGRVLVDREVRAPTASQPSHIVRMMVGEAGEQLFHTRYHHIRKLESSVTKW